MKKISLVLIGLCLLAFLATFMLAALGYAEWYALIIVALGSMLVVGGFIALVRYSRRKEDQGIDLSGLNQAPEVEERDPRDIHEEVVMDEINRRHFPHGDTVTAVVKANGLDAVIARFDRKVVLRVDRGVSTDKFTFAGVTIQVITQKGVESKGLFDGRVGFASDFKGTASNARAYADGSYVRLAGAVDVYFYGSTDVARAKAIALNLADRKARGASNGSDSGPLQLGQGDAALVPASKD